MKASETGGMQRVIVSFLAFSRFSVWSAAMPRTHDRMGAISSALQDLEAAVRSLVDENSVLKNQLQRIVEQAGQLFNGHAPRGRPRAWRKGSRWRPAEARTGVQVHREPRRSEFRKQVEGGKSAASLAKDLKVSLPTMYNTLKRAGWEGGASRVAGGRPAARVRDGTPRKRGRAFKFTTDQAGEFSKQVEGGKSAVALARELKVSLPTMYNTLRRAGWSRRSRGRGRPAPGRSGP